MATSISTPVKAKAQCSTADGSTEQDVIQTVQLAETLKSTPVLPSVNVASCNCIELGPVPHAPPPGFRWKPRWELVKDDFSPNVSIASSSNKSFEEVILDKIKPAVEKPKVKRTKVDLMAKLVTHDEYLQALKEKEEQTKRKKIKLIKNVPEDKEDEEEEEVESLAVFDDESDKSMAESGDEETLPSTEKQAVTYLSKCGNF